MRLWYTLLVLILNIPLTYGQMEEPKTEICIIGTIHTGNKYFNHNTLYKILIRHNPDIILWEQDAEFKRVNGLRTAYFLKNVNPGIEQLALQKYSKRYKGVRILGFDTSFPSKRNYIRELLKIDKQFFDSLNSVRMTFTDSLLYADYMNKRKYYYDLIFKTDIIRINKPGVFNMQGYLYQMEQSHILSLGKKYITDSFVVSQFEKELSFWIDRNNFMLGKLKTYLNQYTGKRIIVLTGLGHKYYLLNKLREQQNNVIKIFEIEN